MKILLRYFFKEFFKLFLIVILSMTAIMVIAEFFDKIDMFYSKKTPASIMLQYLLLLSPQYILYSAPIASLLSILITIGRASKWKETVAIKASGGSLKRIFSAFLMLGVLISFTALLFGEIVVPAAVKKATWVKDTKILKQSRKISFRAKALWLKGIDGSLIRIRGFVENENKVVGIGIYVFDPSFVIEKRIEAEEGEWVDGIWRLKNVTVFDFSNDTISKHDSLTTHAIEEPKIFREEMKKPEEMNFMELHRYYSRLENAGFRNVKYVMRLYEKLSYPTVNFVMILFGLTISLNARWGGGIRSAGLGIAISVIYWLIYSISISLGNTGSVPPWFAPWISPLIFGIAGSIMFVRMKE